jgi:hypothetical protein
VTAGTTIALSLISHTNTGKTTLARTLLRRDVGEVRDAPHVTVESAAYPLIDTADDDHLVLWDTPGFGNSARLAQRLQQQGNPVGWFLAQVWDRFRDRSFWLTQQAVRNVRDRADAVLYLVNAAEAPGDAGYLAPELTVLEWIGKPVVVLLNQTGPPSAAEGVEEARWREALRAWPQVSAVIALDAFARCWIHEVALFDVVANVLPEGKRDAFARLAAAWNARRIAQFDAAMAALAVPLAHAAGDRVLLPADPLMMRIGRSLGLARSPSDHAGVSAEREMAARVVSDLRACTDRLIAVHELEGRAAADVLARVDGDVRRETPLDEAKSAMMGGLVTGALTGLTADLAAGGLTLGGGMLAGAVLGALGGAGVARGMNVARDKNATTLRWDDVFLDALVVDVMLRYLAVAHYGRGRGEWREREYPAFWREAVMAAAASHRSALAAIWQAHAPVAADDRRETDLAVVLKAIAGDVLATLYPAPARG